MKLKEKFFDQIPGESYEEFLTRVLSFEKKKLSFGVEKFIPSNSVYSKVGVGGNFNYFVGDTVVFNLSDSEKQFIQNYYIDKLYNVAGNCLAEKFDESMLHMTLHDLHSSTHLYDGVMQKMFNEEIILAQKIEEADIESQTISMITTCVFNMVNTSLVLGLIPKTHEDYQKLISLYYLVDEIHKLPYLLTPHITLAYYGTNGFEGEQLERLQRTVNELNQEQFEINLSTDRLYYQKFLNMNKFFNIMPFVKKQLIFFKK